MVREMIEVDWPEVARIYKEGMDTQYSTFQTEVPTYDAWDQSHIKEGRYVAIDEEKKVVGWIALSPTSSRYVYRGVMEVSVYISNASRGQQIGTTLLNHLVEVSERLGIWTLQSSVFQINCASVALHKKCGFRVVGTRERIAKDVNGVWQNTYLMERRSSLF